MKPEQKTVYTRIDQPIETRKEILNQVISIINILKSYDNIKRLQEEKIRYKNRLEKSIYQIQNVMKRLDESVPPLNKELKPLFTNKKQVIQRKQPDKKEIKQTHNQRLNQQLQEIQDKLKNIKI